jgi:hypothetical protein
MFAKSVMPARPSTLLGSPGLLQLPTHFESAHTAGDAPTRRGVFALWARAAGVSILYGIVDCSLSCKPSLSFFLLGSRNGLDSWFSHVQVWKLLIIRQFAGDAMPSHRVFDCFDLQKNTSQPQTMQCLTSAESPRDNSVQSLGHWKRNVDAQLRIVSFVFILTPSHG